MSEPARTDVEPSPSDPWEAIVQIATGLWLSRALWAAARLRLADALEEEPLPAEVIGARTGTDPDSLRRLLDALAAAGIVACNADRLYSHTALSRLLRSDHPSSPRAYVEIMFGAEPYAAWGAIETSLRNGTPAFDGQYGMPLLDYLQVHPESGRRLDEAMGATTRSMEAALLGAHRLPPFERAIDVGGGRGSLLSGLLQQQPAARGILFDLEEIVAPVRPSLAGTRMEAVAGNFFESVPVGGDLYLLKLVLHAWADDQAAEILASIRRAILPGGRLAIFETVLPKRVQPHPGYLMDLNMLVMTGGRERRASDFRNLLEQTGFALDKITPTPTSLSIVEAVAV
ncbi:methyltransferase [Sphingosinicella terrae]|uniref:methyltransferase n=1 Tax=Sphingosinicella terrae TaxID=2172047 RepID=UPI000E0CDEC9|nr:methyltransferase [Sphingosinicella terrae]